jgi:hypothetical protein
MQFYLEKKSSNLNGWKMDFHFLQFQLHSIVFKWQAGERIIIHLNWCAFDRDLWSIWRFISNMRKKI